MRAVGVDLGGHNIAAALVEDGRILDRLAEPTAGRTPEAVTDQIATWYRDWPTPWASLPGSGSPASRRGARVPLLLPNFTGWERAAARDDRGQVGRPVRIENDANCYALGEGWGRGPRTD